MFGGNGVIGYTSTALIAGERIVIGRVGSCGSVHFIDSPVWVTDNALYSKAVGPHVVPSYLARLLEYLDLSRLRNKGAQPLITQSSILRLEVDIPPSGEQLKIGSSGNRVGDFGAFQSAGSMHVRILSRRYSSSRSP